MILEPSRVTDEGGYAAALAIRRRVFVEEQGVSAALEVDAYERDATFFLVRRAGVPLGTGRFRRKGALLKFERIATLPEARRLGVGAALMRLMEADGARLHPQHLQYMHAQASAVRFYEKLGWDAVGGSFREADIEHLAMMKPPAAPAAVAGLLCLADPETPAAVLERLRARLESR